MPSGVSKQIEIVLIYIPAKSSDNNLAIRKKSGLTTAEFCLIANGLLPTQTQTHSEQGPRHIRCQTRFPQMPTPFQAWTECLQSWVNRAQPSWYGWEVWHPDSLPQNRSLKPCRRAGPPTPCETQKSLYGQRDICSGPTVAFDADKLRTRKEDGAPAWLSH